MAYRSPVIVGNRSSPPLTLVVFTAFLALSYHGWTTAALAERQEERAA